MHVEYFECYICDATIPEEEEKDIEVCQYCFDTSAHDKCLENIGASWKEGEFVCPNCDPNTWNDTDEESESDEVEDESANQINSRQERNNDNNSCPEPVPPHLLSDILGQLQKQQLTEEHSIDFNLSDKDGMSVACFYFQRIVNKYREAIISGEEAIGLECRIKLTRHK